MRRHPRRLHHRPARRSPSATILTASSTLTLAGLTAALLMLRQQVSDRATNLIAEGREALPIATVQRQRQRLLAQRRRKALAKALDTVLRQATAPPRNVTRGARPLFDVRVIAAVGAVSGVIRLLQTRDPPGRGVALMNRLITDRHQCSMAASLCRSRGASPHPPSVRAIRSPPRFNRTSPLQLANRRHSTDDRERLARDQPSDAVDAVVTAQVSS